MRKKLDVIDVNEKNNRQQQELTMKENRRCRQRQRARQLAIKRRRRQRFLQMMGLGAVSVIVLVIAGKLFFPVNEEGKPQGSAGAVDAAVVSGGLYEVEYEEFFEENKPQQLSDAEVYRRLKELAEEYPELETIYEKGDTSVAGKPELTEEEKEQKYPLFLQWDKRWGYEAYGDFNIALSGCGPTTLAMAAVALTDDHTITPDRVAKYSMTNGYYVEGTGTAWSLMTDGCENFGIKSNEISLDEYIMKNQLDEGKVLICSMREGDFTSVGHFIMIYGYNSAGFFVNDANCIYRSSRTWSYEELKNQIRILWAFEEK